MSWLGRGAKRKNKTSPRFDSELDISMPDGEAGEEVRGVAEAPLPHPRLWAILGVAYIIIGLYELVLAALWRFWIGIAVGFGVVKLGVSLWGLGATGGRQYTPLAPSGIGGRVKAAFWRVVMWGSGKMQRLLYLFRWLIYAYGLLALLMLLIHLGSPDPYVDTFPLACPPTKRFGCSRVAAAAPHATRHMQPLHLNATMADAQAAAVAWAQAQPQPRIMLQRPGFVHARFLSVFWGFADDMFISFRCNEQQQTVVEVQGQLRIGKSDLGVNARRNQRFLLAVSTAAKQGEIPAGQCLALAG